MELEDCSQICANYMTYEARTNLLGVQEASKMGNFEHLAWPKESQNNQVKIVDLKLIENRDFFSKDAEIYTDLTTIGSKDPSTSQDKDLDHFDNNFKCASCAKSFNSKTSIRLHMLKRHKTKKLYTCELCGSKLDSSPDLFRHINTEHKSIDDRFYCRKCDFNTTNYSEISMHTHESHSCKECGRVFRTLDKFETHKLVHSKEKKQEKNFTCDTCGKRFAFGCLLRDHINLHTGAKPYLCQTCGRSFSQKASLKQHARTHNAVRPHKCPECDQGFFGKGDLKKHLRKHTGERPYVCEMCGEGFSQSSHLGFHKRTHTGERPYPCDVCGRGFTKKGDVARHKRIHTGELPYLCQVCGKTFRQSTQCANHIKNHHPYSQVSVAPNPNPISSSINFSTS